MIGRLTHPLDLSISLPALGGLRALPNSSDSGGDRNRTMTDGAGRPRIEIEDAEESRVGAGDDATDEDVRQAVESYEESETVRRYR